MGRRDLEERIHYELKLTETTAGSGYFAAVPVAEIEFQNGLLYLHEHPFDDFMRKHLIGKIQYWTQEKLLLHLKAQSDSDDPLLLSLICEACLLNPNFAEILSTFPVRKKKDLLPLTSLIYIKAHLLKDHDLHARWATYFHDNIYRHRPLPPPEKSGLRLLKSDFVPEEVASEKSLKEFHRRLSLSPHKKHSRLPARETAKIALERLSGQDILADDEMRHEASLSPYALLRRWRLDRSIENRRLNYRISGIQTAYGKGVDLDSARASYAMEIVERFSAYARIEGNRVIGTKQFSPLMYGRRSDLIEDGHEVIDPNLLGLEVPYDDAPLHWIASCLCEKVDNRNVLVPVQCVFLFSNLDEISLYSGLGSTGLASGNTLAEAKLSALLEILERDSEAVYPYHPTRCFRVVADDPGINSLLEDYHRRGIQVQFQDISPAYGVPCCKCFVVHRNGTIAKGACGHLDGKKAVISALTETPFPYPYGPPSMPMTLDLPVLRYEDLPDFSLNDAALDLELLESVLCANGLYPHYIDLTRSDLDMPVVKALIPGLEIMNDFDSFSRISPRLFFNYQKLYDD